MGGDFQREQILDHYRHPRNYGSLPDADICHEDLNPLCGDQVRFEAKVDGSGRIERAAFTGRGCAISQASASMLTERVRGMTLDDVKAMDTQDVLDMLGIPLSPVRLKCALLPLKVLQAGVYHYEARESGDNSRPPATEAHQEEA